MKKILVLLCSLFYSIVSFSQNTILVITPHPDDAEASCGGLIINSVLSGKQVVILTMTGGELGIGGKSNDEARNIREQEAKNAADLMHAKIKFFGAIDGSLAVDIANTNKLDSILLLIKPSIVLAPWPLDVHNDHQATGLLAWRVFQDNRFSFELFFYETINEPHTKTFGFTPTDYVDISDVLKQKRQAVFKHQSQHPEEWYDMYETLSKLRGYESDTPFAESFIKARNSSGIGGRSNKVEKTLK